MISLTIPSLRTLTSAILLILLSSTGALPAQDTTECSPSYHPSEDILASMLERTYERLDALHALDRPFSWDEYFEYIGLIIFAAETHCKFCAI
ncbi:MAG TPA: hypothetical protein DIU37_04735 [Opitutae bacterium]|nr:hypothetical protein [Opitutae bacterium]